MKNQNTKIYSRAEKIKYYENEIQYLEYTIQKLIQRLEQKQKRLEFIESENYQDWNSNLETQLKTKKQQGKAR